MRAVEKVREATEKLFKSSGFGAIEHTIGPQAYFEGIAGFQCTIKCGLFKKSSQSI